jgi:hypothetical protein
MAPGKSPCAIIGTARYFYEIEEIVLVFAGYPITSQVRPEFACGNVLKLDQTATTNSTSPVNTPSITD